MATERANGRPTTKTSESRRCRMALGCSLHEGKRNRKKSGRLEPIEWQTQNLTSSDDKVIYFPLFIPCESCPILSSSYIQIVVRASLPAPSKRVRSQHALKQRQTTTAATIPRMSTCCCGFQKETISASLSLSFVRVLHHLTLDFWRRTLAKEARP